MEPLKNDDEGIFGLSEAARRRAAYEAKACEMFDDPSVPYNNTEEFLVYLDIMASKSKKINRQKLENRINGVNKQSLLITISVDNKIPESATIAEMDDVMEHFKKSNYKWLKNGAYTYEFYSGRESTWNPHIHICSDKIGISASQIRQAIDRSPCRKKTKTYNTNVVCGTDDQHERYVRGEKQDSKELNTIKDNEFRKRFKIKSFYNL